MANEITSRFLLIIKELIGEGRVSDGKDFANKIGVSPSSITEINKGRTNVGLSIIQKTVSIYPDISLEWLISGVGEIFKTKTPKNVVKENDHINDHKIDHKQKLQKTWSNTPVTYDMPEQVSLVTEGGAAPYIKGKTFVEVPVVDIDAAAGGGAVNSDYTDEFDKLRIPTTILPATACTRRCINVAGESMEPTLFDGARIIVRLLHRTEWAKIRSGSVYVVTNRDGETFIKRVRNKLRAHGVLVLTSDNPDQRRFKPFELTEEEIFNVWTVELVITDVLLPSQREETDDLRDQISELREMFERFIQREN